MSKTRPTLLLAAALSCVMLVCPLFNVKASNRRPFCDGRQCVFDLGHNSGQDTADYLTSGPPRTRVVAVDANPVLISRSITRFSKHVREGRLRLVNSGLVARESERGNLTFWLNVQNDLYSSFKEELGCRNKFGGERDERMPRQYCRPTTVQTRTCVDLINEFGTPTYLKIDIEGMDMACLHSLSELAVERRPKYVSMENVWLQSMQLLTKLGYDGFKVVDQLNVSWGRPTDMEGASGPWGEDAVDYERGKVWLTQSEVMKRIEKMPRVKNFHKSNLSIWYDVHGRRSSG